MFHVLVGEITITLQNVAIILGLCIHGPTVIGTCVFDVAELYWELLGVIPPVDALKGAPLSPYGGYVRSYPPQHLKRMRSL